MMANCKHESSSVIYSAGGFYLCQCESECGSIFYEDNLADPGNETGIIASPDLAMKEQRDQLAAQVEALAIENEALKKEIGDKFL